MTDTYFHLYNRGAHKEDVFRDHSDYYRMIQLLYIANSDAPLVMSQLPARVFDLKRRRLFADIVAYCLMPNHIHIVVKRSANDSIPRFMHKLKTAYSTYFNKKYLHAGTIWQGSYEEEGIYDGHEVCTLANRIHLNPYRKSVLGSVQTPERFDQAAAVAWSKRYEYSSLPDYLGIIRPQRSILGSRLNLEI